ncbi:AAA family ATPase [Filibacter tadaridae]|uniref:AAA+ ATPase domain-containing protein n=1 Tax=Filibacter tadaridae TaxID=2483811 RepID=A0A3P5XX67_9BACL|nr:AAA family ATPase [Filibacter tadaridae]VDC33772.1 hypothetical protein FILTAD_03040 [Filibacter tadaridae]
MRLKKFSVTNYKVFGRTFSVDFATDSIIILTGRNNTGKSTFLEAINRFFMKETKAATIPSDCFFNRDQVITLEAHFETSDETLIFVKKYKDENAPKYEDNSGAEINTKHTLKAILDDLHANAPYYITPSMSTDDINKQIQTIYDQIIKGNLKGLEENPDEGESESTEHIQMKEEYATLKESLPKFLRKLKSSTDASLDDVSADVSEHLRSLFSNEDLSLRVLGGESSGFSASDILKSTSSSIFIDNDLRSEMPLSNQGTGLQRMSLIYVIQNMIQKKLIGDTADKMLLIDEPEAFLHPEAVRALSRSLYEIGNKMPLIISTHSPILIDLAENQTSIQVLRVGENDRAVQLYKSTTEKFDDDDIKNMRILNYVDSYVNEFFFADKILIVEGDTEYIAIKHFLKKYNKNMHVIRARGKSTICTLMKILNQFDTDYDVLHDVDNHDKYTASTLKAQLTNCKNILKLKVHDNIRVISSMANFELAIGLGDVSNDKKTETIHEIVNDSSTIPSFINARKEIKRLFDYIIQPNQETCLGKGFLEIKSEEDYNLLFSEKIDKKTAEEQIEKATKEVASSKV